MVSKLLEISGVGKERLRLDWVSASEAGRFVQIVTDFTAQVKKLGRFEVEPLRQRLQAALMTVLSGRIRRLVGKQVELIEKGNVYGEKLPAEQFDQLLEGILKDEYIKNRITLMIKEMPLSVREIDAVIKVGPEVISAYVVDLWTGGKVTLHGFEDEDAKFISIGA